MTIIEIKHAGQIPARLYAACYGATVEDAAAKYRKHYGCDPAGEVYHTGSSWYFQVEPEKANIRMVTE